LSKEPGGGAGMLLKIEPLYNALKRKISSDKLENKKNKVILLSARGKKWDQSMAKKYKDLAEITFVCGRYEGVDERITNFIDEEISIGDYVLTGGELGAMVMIDSITRLLPNVLGNQESSLDESHSQKNILEYPQYTKPETFVADGKKYTVPKVLLSGNHQKIKEWREGKKKKNN
jgi:tRNA (guanine37-N1)-methyltransferase